jgi:triosephosphate isomerase
MSLAAPGDPVPAKRPIVGTSWKMNKTRAQAVAWARRVRQRLASQREVMVFVLPPFVAIDVVRDELAGSGILHGAQNVHHEDQGAHTGEVSAPMLAELGCRIVEVGHSERRRDQCETDELIAGKVRAIIRHGMWPLVCVGESGPERDAGRAEEVVRHQLDVILGGPEPADLARVIVAYEPWWAIGEGSVAAPLDHVARLHGLIHAWLAPLGSSGAGAAVPVLYGGSVDLGNAAALLATPGVDGLFVGRAALDPDVFVDIVAGAQPAPRTDPRPATPTTRRSATPTGTS